MAAFLRTGLCPAFLGGPWVSTGRCTCQPGSATPLVSTECSRGLPGQACGSGRSAAALRGPSGPCARAGAARRRPGWGERRAGSSAAAVRGAWQRTPRPRLRARASTRVHVACAHARACGACTCVRAQLNISNPVTFSSGRGCVERHTTPSNGRAVTPRAVCGGGDTGRVVPPRPRHRRRVPRVGTQAAWSHAAVTLSTLAVRGRPSLPATSAPKAPLLSLSRGGSRRRQTGEAGDRTVPAQESCLSRSGQVGPSPRPGSA